MRFRARSALLLLLSACASYHPQGPWNASTARSAGPSQCRTVAEMTRTRNAPIATFAVAHASCTRWNLLCLASYHAKGE